VQPRGQLSFSFGFYAPRYGATILATAASLTAAA